MARKGVINVKAYRSAGEALRVRTKACELAAVFAADRDWDSRELMALCVFFESYIAHGPTWTEHHMHLLDPIEDKSKPASVVQLITRD